MTAILRLVGRHDAALALLAADMQEDGVSLETAGGARADLLVTFTKHADVAIAAATTFAAGDTPERLIVMLWPLPGPDHWEAKQDAAAMAAFTRHAALQWAPARLRVNALTLAPHPGRTGTLGKDVVRSVMAMARWRSMTGQIIVLS